MEIEINFWTGVIGRWKKKKMILEKENIIILPPNESNISPLRQVISLLNALIYDSNKNFVLRIDVGKHKYFIQLKINQEKNLIFEKITDNIQVLQEKNAYSKDFKYYNDEIQKSPDIKGNFNNVQTNISELINYFIEISIKINDFRTIIDSSKLSKDTKNKLIENHSYLNLIKDEMKIKFDDLVQNIYDYRDMNELLQEDSFQNNNIANNNQNTLISKLNNPQNIQINNIEKKLKFEFEESYNFPPRKTIIKKLQINKNMISELIKAYTSGQKTLPIHFNEPISMLQKECEKFYYSNLLNKASEQKTIELKLCYITAFIISEISLNIGRQLKPMVPLIGETFEYIDNNLKYKFFSEEVQRRPHVSAFYAEGEKWKYYGDNKSISNFKFMSGSYEIEFQSKVHIELYCDDTNDFIHFIFNKPNTLLKGIINNKMYYDFYGDICIKTPSSSEIVANIKFENEKKNIELGQFYGEVKNGGNIIYKLGGNWKKEIYITDKDNNNKEILFNVPQLNFYNNTSEHYEMLEYNYNFNYLDDKLKNILPISDTRFRPDKKEYENGNDEKAQEIKSKLEVNQVKRQEIYDNNQKEYKPYYFTNKYNQDSCDFIYMYNGGYWEDRKNHSFDEIVDIFNLD